MGRKSKSTTSSRTSQKTTPASPKPAVPKVEKKDAEGFVPPIKVTTPAKRPEIYLIANVEGLGRQGKTIANPTTEQIAIAKRERFAHLYYK